MRPTLLFLAAALLAAPALAQNNYGASQPNPVKPFTASPLATFDNPWALAFLPDTRMLVTEKPGRLWLVDAKGGKVAVTGVPPVAYAGQGGLLFVAVSPHYAQDRAVYLTYAEPGRAAPAWRSRAPRWRSGRAAPGWKN